MRLEFEAKSPIKSSFSMKDLEDLQDLSVGVDYDGNFQLILGKAVYFFAFDVKHETSFKNLPIRF